MTDESSQICPKCGARIPAAAPDGICPSCVLIESQQRSAAADAPNVEEITKAFPDLEIERLLGRGGMGAVYLARQPKLDRKIALKVLLPDAAADPAFAERFHREARALATLNHPNIVSLYEFGEQAGFYFLAMELVDGVNLRQAMDAGRFTPREALEVIPGICNALEAAHAQGILHRDIKPENILLDSNGNVKIVDFGIARIVGDPASEFTLTEIGAVLGSRQYMAPEQVEQAHEIDHRADIYSLGVVFYEMLTGELPIGRFLPPSMKSSTNETIEQIVLRTLEKELDRRFQSVCQVRTEVQAADDAPAAAPGRSGGGIIGIPTFTFWTLTLCVAGGLLAGIFGVLSDGLAQKIVVVPITIGMILILLGYAGCWLALAAIRRNDLASTGKRFLQFMAVLGPLVCVGWGAALASAEWFHELGRGCIYWTILLSGISTCLAALAVKTAAGVNLSKPARRPVIGVAVGIGLVLLTFAFLMDGRWPYAHMLLRAELEFKEINSDDEREMIRGAINPAFGTWEGAYYAWFDEARDVMQLGVLNSERSPIAAADHLEAYALRVLDLLPAEIVEHASLELAGISVRDPYGTYAPLFLSGLLAALAGACFGILSFRSVGFSIPAILVLSGTLSVLSPNSLSSAPRSIGHIPYIQAPPLPPFDLPEYELDLATVESAAATLMEAAIRNDKAILRQVFSKEWTNEGFESRANEYMNSFQDNVRLLGVVPGYSRPDVVQVKIKAVRRDGNGTGGITTTFHLEEGEWRVSVPR
ncbi:MAG: serine/threonine-protein kinase [Verrucomicrobiota bacterium]